MLRLATGLADLQELSWLSPQEFAPWVKNSNADQHVLNALAAHGTALSPEWGEYKNRLSAGSLRTAALNLKYRHLLRPLLVNLRAAGIDHMLIKGAALLLRYGSLAGRPMGDIDLLVHRRDLNAVHDQAMAYGFVEEPGQPPLAELLARHYHRRYLRQGLVLELHWDVSRITPSAFLDALWATRENITRDAFDWTVPATAASLVLSCVHLSRHGFSGGLRWMGDIAQEACAASLDIAAFQALAAHWPERMVWPPMRLLRDLGNEPAWPMALPATMGVVDHRLLATLALRAMFIEPADGPRSQTAYVLQQWVHSRHALARVAGPNLWSRIARVIGASARPHHPPG